MSIDLHNRRATASTGVVLFALAAAMQPAATQPCMAKRVDGTDSTSTTFLRLPASLGLAEQFRSLRDQWKRDTSLVSSFTAMVSHPAYLRIIAMGNAAVPMILAELRAEPDHWFAALGAITDGNPVPESAAGDLDKMTAAWLGWGREKGLLS